MFNEDIDEAASFINWEYNIVPEAKKAITIYIAILNSSNENKAVCYHLESSYDATKSIGEKDAVLNEDFRRIWHKTKN